jgi:hypothetical protein
VAQVTATTANNAKETTTSLNYNSEQQQLREVPANETKYAIVENMEFRLLISMLTYFSE